MTDQKRPDNWKQIQESQSGDNRDIERSTIKESDYVNNAGEKRKSGGHSLDAAGDKDKKDIH